MSGKKLGNIEPIAIKLAECFAIYRGKLLAAFFGTISTRAHTSIVAINIGNLHPTWLHYLQTGGVNAF